MTRDPETMTDEECSDEARELAIEASGLTREMAVLLDLTAGKARRRAECWERCLALGMAQKEAAAIAGIHPSKVAKALDRLDRARASA